LTCSEDIPSNQQYEGRRELDGEIKNDSAEKRSGSVGKEKWEGGEISHLFFVVIVVRLGVSLVVPVFVILVVQFSIFF